MATQAQAAQTRRTATKHRAKPEPEDEDEDAIESIPSRAPAPLRRGRRLQTVARPSVATVTVEREDPEALARARTPPVHRRRKSQRRTLERETREATLDGCDLGDAHARDVLMFESLLPELRVRWKAVKAARDALMNCQSALASAGLIDARLERVLNVAAESISMQAPIDDVRCSAAEDWWLLLAGGSLNDDELATILEPKLCTTPHGRAAVLGRIRARRKEIMRRGRAVADRVTAARVRRARP